MRNHSYENDFDLHENETACRTHFNMKGFALRLVLKQRHKRTRKWPIATEKRSVVSRRILFAVFGIRGRVLWRKDPAFALKHYKSMWQYLARNLISILVLLNLWVYGNWRRHATQSSIIRLACTLSLKYLSVKPRLLMKKGWFLEVENLRVS